MAYASVKSLFSDVVLSYKTLFYHFRKWCKNGEWKYMWINLLKKYRSKLDMSSVDWMEATPELRKVVNPLAIKDERNQRLPMPCI